jgi:hypothetical protein
MPLRQSLLAVCLAVLVVTAGCSALGLGGGGDGGDDTTTPTTTTTTTTETTETTTTTTTQNATSFPPGIARNGSIVNEKALMDAHHRILLEEGAVWHLNQNTTLRTSSNESNNFSIEQRIATGGETLYRDRNRASSPKRYTYWANQSVFLSRERAENGTITYGTRAGLDQAPKFGPFMKTVTRAAIIDDLARGNTTLVETEVINGVRYTTIRVVQKGGYDGYNGSQVITFNASGRGVLHSYEYTGPEVFDLQNETVTHSFELKQLGNVTVERPDWASKALNETTESNETSA